MRANRPRDGAGDFRGLWSPGLRRYKYVLNSAEPLTIFRSAWHAVVGLMGSLPRALDRNGLTRPESVTASYAGIMVMGFISAATAVAIFHSIPAGLSAVIPGRKPIMNSKLANAGLGERVTRCNGPGCCSVTQA